MKVVLRSEAKQLGLTRYFTGKLCKHSHVSERLTSDGGCIACKSKRQSLYWRTSDKARAKDKRSYEKRKQNPEFLAKKSATALDAYYANHEVKKEKLRLAYKKRKAENPNLSAELYAQHREKNLANSKIAYQANIEERREYQRHWSKTNRGTANAISKNYKLKKINATPAWLSESQLLHIKCKYQLAAMLNIHGVEAWHVDHIVPIRGKDVCGLHVPWNLRVIPAKENMTKGNRI